MIRYDEGGKDFRHLLYDFNGINTPFFGWLKTLRLDKIYTKELVKELVENGILQYCLRVDLPEEFFTSWERYPVISERMESVRSTKCAFCRIFCGVIYVRDFTFYQRSLTMFLKRIMQNNIMKKY